MAEPAFQRTGNRLVHEYDAVNDAIVTATRRGSGSPSGAIGRPPPVRAADAVGSQAQHREPQQKLGVVSAKGNSRLGSGAVTPARFCRVSFAVDELGGQSRRGLAAA